MIFSIILWNVRWFFFVVLGKCLKSKRKRSFGRKIVGVVIKFVI